MSGVATIPPALVNFDCDGVLVDSEPIADRVLADFFTARGWPCTPPEMGALFLGGTLAGAGEEARRRGARLEDDWLDACYEATFAALERDVRPIPGAAAALAALAAAGLPTCIGSNGPQRKMEVSLGACALDGLMPRRLRYSAHDPLVAAPKPAPDLYLHVARDMGAPPERCVVIEDSRAGATAAIAAGMRCLGYAPRGGRALADLGAEVFDDMADLPRLVGATAPAA